MEMRLALVSGDRCRPDKAGAPAGFVKSASDSRTRGTGRGRESTLGLGSSPSWRRCWLSCYTAGFEGGEVAFAVATM